MAESKIVQATGSAAGRRRGGVNEIEVAMANVIHEASAEAEKIWANAELGLEEKQAKVKEIMSDSAILDRKLKVREAIKQRRRDEEAARAKAEADARETGLDGVLKKTLEKK